jgi:hypothetical protein
MMQQKAAHSVMSDWFNPTVAVDFNMCMSTAVDALIRSSEATR